MSGCLGKVIKGGLVIFGIYIALGVLVTLADRPSSTRSSTRPASSSLTVVYEVNALPGVTGSSSSLTYANETGNTEQHTVDIPWRLQFEVQPGQFLYVSAQSGGYGNACKIKVDGVVLEQADSSGQYSIATCSGTAE